MIEWFRRRIGYVDRRVDHVNNIDLAISRWIARQPPSPLDDAMKAISTAANHGLLWFAIAAVLATRRGSLRRAALRGVLAIAMTSFTANAVFKPLFPRRRPAAAELPTYQTLPDPPTSSSFPSGHAASAAAFTTAVAMESPRAGLAIAPLAAAVAYSRIHVGVHWTSDVLTGVALGSGVAMSTRRWWPVRGTDQAYARPRDDAPALPEGAGLTLLANPRSGDPDHDPADEVAEALPAATVLRPEQGVDLHEQLDEAAAEGAPGDGVVRAVGVAGGDGTVAAAASVAWKRDLPLVVVPTGTLNHFARDVGVYDLQEAADAVQVGEAVAVDLGVVDIHAAGRERHTRPFVNTASLGGYSDLVRLRERWQRRWGKWPAFAAALVTTLRRARPLRVKIDGKQRSVWILFVGNGPYHPRGLVPAWRPRLDSGLLDIRYLRADRRFSRARAVLALLLGVQRHTRTYQQRSAPSLEVELLEGHANLATDGEVLDEAGRFSFHVAEHPITVYRRDEENWPHRPRPHLRR